MTTSDVVLTCRGNGVLLDADLRVGRVLPLAAVDHRAHQTLCIPLAATLCVSLLLFYVSRDCVARENISLGRFSDAGPGRPTRPPVYQGDR